MDSFKQNWPKFLVGGAATVLSIYVLYKLLGRQTAGTIAKRNGANPFSEVIN